MGFGVGACVGMGVGFIVGASVGVAVGGIVAASVGNAVGVSVAIRTACVGAVVAVSVAVVVGCEPPAIAPATPHSTQLAIRIPPTIPRMSLSRFFLRGGCCGGGPNPPVGCP